MANRVLGNSSGLVRKLGTAYGAYTGASTLGGLGLAAALPASQPFRDKQDPVIRKQMADVLDRLDELEEAKEKHIERIKYI